MFIRQMKASNSGRYFLAAEFEKKVAAFDSVSGAKLGEYTTKFDFGGDRLCISDSGKLFAAAAYSRSGITLYEVESGKALWNTKEVKKIQRLYFSADDKVLYAINAENKMFTLSLADGSITSIEKDHEKLYPDIELEVSSAREHLFVGGKERKYPRSLLAICSGGGRVYCSVMCGGFECCDPDLNKLWSAENKAGEHYLRLGYIPKYDYIAAVGFRFDDDDDENEELPTFVDVYSANDGSKL
ncbi:MAG: hypothetical protein J6Z29_10095, partial [Ruminococcus sp.]|nr:hypothetical protein [Ruminococcus sp.]